MSGDLSYESLTHLFRGHIADFIRNGAYYFVGCTSCMSLNESIYNHVPGENKKTSTYKGGESTHFDSYKKNSAFIYPVKLLNPISIALRFSDPLTHTAEADRQNPANPTTATAAENRNHKTQTTGGKTA